MRNRDTSAATAARVRAKHDRWIKELTEAGHLIYKLDAPGLLICQGCSTVLDGRKDGVVHVRYAEINAHRDYWKVQRSLPLDQQIMSMDAFLAAPARAPWQIHCDECNPHTDQNGELCANCYWLSTDRMSTLPDIMDTGAHISEKNWFKDTDWSNFTRHVLRQIA